MGKAGRLLLLSQPRSGTTLLCSLLDSHPLVTFEREMLAEHKYRGLQLRLLPLYKRLPARYLQLRAALKVQRGQTSAYGCKVFPDHLNHDRRALLQLSTTLARAGWQIVALERTDVLKRTISLLVSYRTGLTHGYDQSAELEQRITITRDVFLRAVRAVWIREQEFRGMLEHIPLAARLSYEHDLGSDERRQATADQLFGLLGVAPQLVTTRLRPAWARPYRELLTHYDELVTAGTDLLANLKQGGSAVADIDSYLGRSGPALSAGTTVD